MNSSNNISDNSPFSQKPFSREQIEEARKHSDVFRETDDFEKDALEGWQKASHGVELMKNLDKKFNPKPKFMYWIPAVLILGIIGTFLVIQDHPKENLTITKKDQNTASVIDKSDVVIPEEIKSFKELPSELQIQPTQIVSNFKKKEEASNEQLTNSTNREEETQIILPPKKIQLSSGKPYLSIEKKTAKEIYLADFKLVDYRTYRSKNAIPSEQMILSGTPADQEKAEIHKDDIAWKSIDIPYHNYISQTMEQFKAGNFKQTLNRTKFILEFYPDDINALFYGGLCYYNLSETDQSIDAFEKVLSNQYNNFDEEAFWYLANAYYLKNEKQKARELLQKIVNQKGYYSNQAEKMLKK